MLTASAESAFLDDDDGRDDDQGNNEVDISSASLHELVRVGFQQGYAIRIRTAIQGPGWQNKHFYLTKKQGGIGLLPRHFEVLIERKTVVRDGQHMYNLDECLFHSRYLRCKPSAQLTMLERARDLYWLRVKNHIDQGTPHPGPVECTSFYKYRMKMFDAEMSNMESLYCHTCCEERWVPISRTLRKDHDGNPICHRCVCV